MGGNEVSALNMIKSEISKDTKLMYGDKHPALAEQRLTRFWNKLLVEGAKVDRMVKHIEKSEEKSGKGKKTAQNIAWATANKRGYLNNSNHKNTNK